MRRFPYKKCQNIPKLPKYADARVNFSQEEWIGLRSICATLSENKESSWSTTKRNIIEKCDVLGHMFRMNKICVQTLPFPYETSSVVIFRDSQWLKNNLKLLLFSPNAKPVSYFCILCKFKSEFWLLTSDTFLNSRDSDDYFALFKHRVLLKTDFSSLETFKVDFIKSVFLRKWVKKFQEGCAGNLAVDVLLQSPKKLSTPYMIRFGRTIVSIKISELCEYFPQVSRRTLIEITKKCFCYCKLCGQIGAERVN